MSDWKAEVVRIEKVEKHPMADRLIIVTVLGDYPVVTNLVDLKEGDLIGYLGIDTIVPDTEEFHFLCPMEYERYEDENGEIKQRQIGPKFHVGSVPEKYRIIKAKKIRGIYSQGMLHPIDRYRDSLKEGDSLVELLGLKKWVEEVDDEVKFNGVKVKMRGTNQASPPKGWSIPFYDIESIRKYLKCFLPNEQVVLLEKINGSNSAFCHDGTNLVVKSRNYYKKEDEKDMWWNAANRYDLKNKLAKYPMMVFFAECAGQIKNFRYGAKIVNGSLHTRLFFFDIFDLSKMSYLNYEDSLSIVKGLGLEYAPEIYKGPWTNKEEMYPYAEGLSLVDNKTIREGFVMKPLIERIEPKLNGRWQVKLVSETYNLNK
jgi:RNA ligase (TIGR02306 family)